MPEPGIGVNHAHFFGHEKYKFSDTIIKNNFRAGIILLGDGTWRFVGAFLSCP